MDLRKGILTCIVAIALYPAYGQAQFKAEEKPYIEVTGIAEQEVVPDEIYIDIEIREQKGGADFARQEERLKAIVRELGIALSDLRLSDAITDYMKVRFKSGTIKLGKSYSLKVRDAATVGKLFYRLDKDDVAEARIERLDYSGMDSLKRATRIMAIKAAKEKADYLLQAVGQKLGTAMVINEQEQLPYMARNLAANNSYQEYEYKGKQEVAFEKLKVRSAIYIKFAIQ